MSDKFGKFSRSIAKFTGNAYVFIVAFSFISVWVISGPFFGFSNEWQLVVNTITTIITFLMVFVIQNSQNHDTKAMHLKLDALILGLKKADKDLVDLENLSDDELEKLENIYSTIAHERRRRADLRV